MKTLSVVIANYNYARFLSSSIGSALAVDWPDLDVVVVDDGSTDNSRDVIEQFGSKVTAIFTENRGQREAVNVGFAACRGDVVIFLDADDTLPPGVAVDLQRNYRSTISKWQFRMQPIDECGRDLGYPFPNLSPVPTSEQMREWLVTTSAHPTPPGSGNAYARNFLESVLPVDASAGSAADSALLATAPLGGEIVIVPSVLVGYRRHTINDSNLLTDPEVRFWREVERAKQRWSFAVQFASRLHPPVSLDPGAWRRSRELLQFRCVAWRLRNSGYRDTTETLSRLTVDILRSPWVIGPESWSRRLAIGAFCAAVLGIPLSMLPGLLARRFAYR